IRVVKNKHQKGAAGARNTGIDEARGRYIAFIDSDDKWVGEKIEKQIDFMRKKDSAFSFTGYEFADEKCKGTGKIVRVPESISYKEALRNTTIFTSTVMFDMDRLSKEDIVFPYIASEDTANWWKILRNNGPASGLDEALTLYRRSAGTLSSNKLEAIKRVWALYRKSERLSVPYSLYCFAGYAFRAVKRRV
ncbi:MAG: glycosyltransferase, partial [Lachnospiraceae bacterium]|nr:glycosyltransferase [Lachnospiraceae bacterium]